MRLTLIVSTILALSSPMAFAGAKCDCSPKCHAQCQKGDTQNCKCTHCDCAKGGKCDQGCSDKRP